MLLVAPVARSIRRRTDRRREKAFRIETVAEYPVDHPRGDNTSIFPRAFKQSRRKDNPLYYRTIKKFEEKYGCPVIINTSFNVGGEPIVCTPEHAISLFHADQRGLPPFGKFPARKKDQKPLDKDIDWLKEFELD